MNNSTVSVNNAGIPIHNPTVYNPDIIIGRYVQKQKTDVATEIQKQMQNQVPQVTAAQNLFTRAVRDHERAQYSDVITGAICIASFLREIATLKTITGSLLEFALALLLTGLFYAKIVRFALGCLFYMFMNAADKLGIQSQYSV